MIDRERVCRFHYDEVNHKYGAEPYEIGEDIVRCKECNKYFYDKLNDAWFCRIHEYGEEFKPDDFCSYGERRE